MDGINDVKIVDDINESSYKDIPIDDFGQQMLNRMMKTSTSYMNKKRKHQPLIEFKERNSTYGLGYKESDTDNDKTKNKSELISFYGKTIIIIKGEFKEHKGKILLNKKYSSFKELSKENKYILIELDVNKKKYEIKSSHIKLFSEDKTEKIQKNNISNKEEKKIEKQKIKWIQPNIIIRIIDKNSKYFNTKAKVEDIINEDTFSLLTDDNTVHTEFCEDNCETYIPKINETVLILNGEFKSKKGILLFRDKKQNLVNVQLLNKLSVVTLTQDDISAAC